MLTEVQYMQQQVDDLLYGGEGWTAPAAVVKSLEAQIEMVRSGVGMAVVPSGVERFCREGSVSFYSFSDQLLKREPAVIWRKGVKLSKTAQELIGVIKTIEW